MTRGTGRRDQQKDVRRIRRQTGRDLQDLLVQLGHAEPLEMASALADYLGLPFVDLDGVEIPGEVITLVPESLAREQRMLPVIQGHVELGMVFADPRRRETVAGMEFVLNQDVRPMLGLRDQVLDAIAHHYDEGNVVSLASGSYQLKPFRLNGPIPEPLRPLVRDEVVRLCFNPPLD